MRGTHFLAGSIFFSALTVSWVLWDNRNQQQKRTSSVRSILASAQRQKNMEEYLEQQKLYEEYKMSVFVPKTDGHN
ncbi:hypothetical protein niasHT_039114 [Heterodera trifolii]|uniref:Cytochrome c oxidase assembly protein n=1 Tax=Heterodera trifolii TaxID=157864 RepID=A0ABD2IM57_9BILA